MHLTFLIAAALSANGWQTLFDGKTLDGWIAPDMTYWSVEDGALTGTVTPEHRPAVTQFIAWTKGKVGDFDLTFKFRIFGPKANSGMQFRGEVREHGFIHGYQADIAKTGSALGGIFDEFGPRNALAGRGDKVAIDKAGKRTVRRFADPAVLLAGIDLALWHDYAISARGSKIVLRIDGQITAELDDREAGKARLTGVLGMPVIPEPMKVQYKDIRLRQ